jgi:hypothetical protein
MPRLFWLILQLKKTSQRVKNKRDTKERHIWQENIAQRGDVY